MQLLLYIYSTCVTKVEIVILFDLSFMMSFLCNKHVMNTISGHV